MTFTDQHRLLGGESLLLSNVIKGDGEFLQYAALANANVAVSVRATKRIDLAMVLSSIQEVPAAYVVVPNCLKLDPEKATTCSATTHSEAGCSRLLQRRQRVVVARRDPVAIRRHVAAVRRDRQPWSPPR